MDHSLRSFLCRCQVCLLFKHGLRCATEGSLCMAVLLSVYTLQACLSRPGWLTHLGGKAVVVDMREAGFALLREMATGVATALISSPSAT